MRQYNFALQDYQKFIYFWKWDENAKFDVLISIAEIYEAKGKVDSTTKYYKDALEVVKIMNEDKIGNKTGLKLIKPTLENIKNKRPDLKIDIE